MSPNPTLKDLAIIPIQDTQWYSLGVRLGVQHDVLDSIEANYSNPNRRKRQMFKRWLEISPNPSWNTLLAALDEIGATEISECVREEYDLPPLPPPSPMVPAPQQMGEDIDAGFVEVGFMHMISAADRTGKRGNRGSLTWALSVRGPLTHSNKIQFVSHVPV